ncbi:SDR family oxidoreductase [Micromonospora sp. NPDC003776]
MKIVVIGGTGLIGSKLVAILSGQGHEAVAASPKSGVNTLTGEGLAEALAGADVVVDVSNSPSFEDAAVLEFFQTSTRNLLAAEPAAGVRHHVALSIVGADRMPDSGYLRAKAAQEKLIRESGLPWSIVRATQFFEFVPGIVDAATQGDTVHLAPVLIRPMAADDVAAAVADVAIGAPTEAVVDVAGPEEFRLDELGRTTLAERADPRQVVTDPGAAYFGAVPTERSLVPSDGARIAATRLADWRARAR